MRRLNNYRKIIPIAFGTALLGIAIADRIRTEIRANEREEKLDDNLRTIDEMEYKLSAIGKSLSKLTGEEDIFQPKYESEETRGVQEIKNDIADLAKAIKDYIQEINTKK